MRNAAPCKVRKGQRGFTLVEVLAALAIASLVMVSLNLAAGTVRRGVEAARETLGAQASLSTAIGIFRRDVSAIAKLLQKDDTYLFDGSTRQMIYALNEERGGLYRVRLRVVETGEGLQLIRDRAPILPGGMTTVSAWTDEVVLLEGSFDVSFAYRAQRSGGRGWQESWSGARAMPEQIRLTIGDRATGRLRVPVIVQPLLVDAEVQCAAASGCVRQDLPGASP